MINGDIPLNEDR